MRLFYETELRAAKSLVGALLIIDGCMNPSGDGEHDCGYCAFSNGSNCAKLFLSDWEDALTKAIDTWNKQDMKNGPYPPSENYGSEEEKK